MEAAIGLRPDHESLRRMNREPRTPERLVAHYELERRLAERLRGAPAEARTRVYSEVYAELFAALPDHPQRTRDDAGAARRVAEQVAMLSPLLPAGGRYLEIGCGDAALTFAMASRAAAAYGCDVTDALVDRAAAPPNFRMLLSDGVTIPLSPASVDLAYSNQLMEHLHPDDAAAQLREVARVLRPGGRYLCRTPSRLTGPHDISAYFGYEAQGFHLREYDYRSLRRLMLDAGFRRVVFVLGGRRARLPFWCAAAIETALDRLAQPLRSKLARRLGRILEITALAER